MANSRTPSHLRRYGYRSHAYHGHHEHISGCTNVTISVTNWNEYPIGWDIGDSAWSQKSGQLHGGSLEVRTQRGRWQLFCQISFWVWILSEVLWTSMVFHPQLKTRPTFLNILNCIIHIAQRCDCWHNLCMKIFYTHFRETPIGCQMRVSIIITGNNQLTIEFGINYPNPWNEMYVKLYFYDLKWNMLSLNYLEWSNTEEY